MHLASVDEIAATTDMPREELAAALEDMACRLLLYSGVTEDGKPRLRPAADRLRLPAVVLLGR